MTTTPSLLTDQSWSELEAEADYLESVEQRSTTCPDWWEYGQHADHGERWGVWSFCWTGYESDTGTYLWREVEWEPCASREEARRIARARNRGKPEPEVAP